MSVPEIPDGVVTSAKDVAHFSTELLESEAIEASKVVFACQAKYMYRANTVENLEMLRDEVLTRLSEVGIIATFDPAPCFYGEPPLVEFVGKVPGDALHKFGFDHEQKSYEVKKSTARGEQYLGEKERANTRRPK